MSTDPRIEAAARALYASVNKPHAERFGWDEVKPRWQENYRSDARAALAAADKAATIATDEGLNSLPVGTTALDAEHDVFTRLLSGWSGMVREDRGDPWLARGLETIPLPARVIHWGTE